MKIVAKMGHWSSVVGGGVLKARHDWSVRCGMENSMRNRPQMRGRKGGEGEVVKWAE